MRFGFAYKIAFATEFSDAVLWLSNKMNSNGLNIMTSGRKSVYLCWAWKTDDEHLLECIFFSHFSFIKWIALKWIEAKMQSYTRKMGLHHHFNTSWNATETHWLIDVRYNKSEWENLHWNIIIYTINGSVGQKELPIEMITNYICVKSDIFYFIKDAETLFSRIK